RLKTDAFRIFQAALKAADPAEAVERHLRIREDIRKVFVVGAGKAGAAMAQAVERKLGRRIEAGWVNVKYGHVLPGQSLPGRKPRRIELCECGHPVPDKNGVRGAERIEAIAKSAGEDDLVVCLISGGASALMPAPAPPVTLDDTRKITELLLRAGADIHEMNCIRKHISRLKGGHLAQLASPARVLTLILSDVIGDDLDVIGSGPMVADRSTFQDAKAILQRHGILRDAPKSVRERIESGAKGKLPETPKPGDPIFSRVENVIIGSNRQALSAAARAARSLGYLASILSSFIEGEAKEVARVHAAIAKELATHKKRKPSCIISGGETTVAVRGKGLGGRNTEFALSAAREIAGLPDTAIFSAGTDGTDGPTDAAGAFADGTTIARAKKLGLNAETYLANNDSYHFFEALGDLYKTGPTNTNVMDVQLVLIQ
ncbi:MAG: glycerate kinase type-2 family protein, partial [Bryobacteraceae bacterium]